jgi:hypothetical protein
MSDWLRRLNELNPERHPSSERSEIPRNSHFGDNGPNGPGISSLKQPPLDPDGSPAGSARPVAWGSSGNGPGSIFSTILENGTA